MEKSESGLRVVVIVIRPTVSRVTSIRICRFCVLWGWGIAIGAVDLWGCRRDGIRRGVVGGVITLIVWRVLSIYRRSRGWREIVGLGKVSGI